MTPNGGIDLIAFQAAMVEAAARQTQAAAQAAAKAAAQAADKQSSKTDKKF